MSEKTEYHTLEEWRPIPDTDGWYDASTHGRIRSWLKHRGLGRRDIPRILKAWNGGHGYLAVGICVPHQPQRRAKVHSLICKAFLGPRPEGYQANHIDGNRSNNHISNLEYVTPSENIRHARDVLGGLGNQTLTREQALEVITYLTQGKFTQGEIAAMFGVVNGTVSAIWDGGSWSDLPRDYPMGINYGDWCDNRSAILHRIRDTEGLGTQILTREQAENIIAMLTKGRLSQKKIGKIYGVDKGTIGAIWKSRNWSDLPRSYPVGMNYNDWRVTRSDNVRRERGIDEDDGQVLNHTHVEKIVDHLTEGKLEQTAIAVMFRVTPQAINLIWKRRNWTSVLRLYPPNIPYNQWRKMQREKREATDLIRPE
jgi:hypothetical protein